MVVRRTLWVQALVTWFQPGDRMRLSQDKIKQGILHTDRSVRDAAALHFAVAYTEDRSVMPMVTKAIDTYGHEEAFSDLEPFQMLPQSDASVTWLAQEIARVGNASDRSTWEYVSNLSWILAEADASLLKRRRKEVLGLRYLDADARESIQQRTRLLSLSGEQCWLDFEQCCEQLADPDQDDQHNLLLGRAYQLLEAVGHHPSEFAIRVLACLDGADDRLDLVAAWKQVCCIQAVGQMRLVEAVPRLIAILQAAREEWVRDDCVTALVRIGGDAVVKAIWNACAVQPAAFYDYAAWILECVHSDLAAEAALHLLQQSNGVDTKIALAHALLSDFPLMDWVPCGSSFLAIRMPKALQTCETPLLLCRL